MTALRSDNVQRGVWTDHSQRFGFRTLLQEALLYACLTTAGTQLLVTNSTSNLVTNVLGILVALACARLFRIVLRGLELLGTFDDDPRGPESFAWRNVRAGLDAMWQGAIHLGPQQPVPPARRRESLRFFGMSLALLIVFVAFVVFGVLTALLAMSNIALSNDPRCGLYMPQDLTWPNNLNISRPYESSVQAESGTLANSCLNSGNPDCGTFLDPSFHLTVENSTCPFEEHMCYGHGVSPVRVSTGAVSARKIGISSPGLLEFNRTTICSPLNMNRTYVNLARKQGGMYTFGYYYGKSDLWSTASYETIRRSDRGDIPTYEVAALWSDEAPASPWWPIKSLTPMYGSTTTLIIVVSQKINYLEKSLDPIFPAQDNTTIQGDPRTFYINLSGPGTVIGCIDRTEWRDQLFNASWFPLPQLPTKEMHDSQNSRAIYFLTNSLIGSNIFSTLNLRLTAALDAESRISGFVSLPLAKEQWKTEVQRLFNISLARIMINARDISRGAKSEYYGFEKLPTTEVDICQETYLVQSIGWRNINFSGVIWILCTSILVILLAITFTKQTANGEVEVLSIEYACKWLWAFGRWLLGAIHQIWDIVMRMWQHRPRLPSWSTIVQTVSRIFTC